MAALANLAISGLLRARVRTEDGLDLGLGHMAWMHPPAIDFWVGAQDLLLLGQPAMFGV